MKEIKTTEVSYEEFTEFGFISPATFYILNASGIYVFYHSSDRASVQSEVDLTYGKGRYTVKASKIQKGKSKLESGGLSCTGTATRRGQKR